MLFFVINYPIQLPGQIAKPIACLSVHPNIHSSSICPSIYRCTTTYLSIYRSIHPSSHSSKLHPSMHPPSIDIIDSVDDAFRLIELRKITTTNKKHTKCRCNFYADITCGKCCRFLLSMMSKMSKTCKSARRQAVAKAAHKCTFFLKA